MKSINNTQVIKFLYSYNGRIIPRRSDGKLRYIGGFTRVLSVDRSISFSELMVKFGELCGSSMSLKCKLPSEDLDVLVSIMCDEDLLNVIQEYDRCDSEMKIRAVLFPLNSTKKISPPLSPMSCFDFPATRMKTEKVNCFYSPPSYVAAAARCYDSPAFGYPVGGRNTKFYYPRHRYYVAPRNHSH
ncbi:uncharacterized protein LOC132055983 [Lycium ferocissimum]|uniref:uncharacterized protein LOC132055983 n=1 Tax=Lycium ferocissimum TaxID=112874 RepID=UPI002815C095|nr:uncharacterized protein LOC132055983 [Lycium ferocissimum]